MSLAERISGAPHDSGTHARLRRATARAHAAVEEAVDIRSAVLDSRRMRALLERFWGFHAAWEPEVSRRLGSAAPARRLPILEADLAALGCAYPSHLPVCPEAAPAAGAPALWGSVYVLEGSALGGRVITRMLRDAGWPRPPRYFDPYGEATGVRWRAVRFALEAFSDPEEEAALVAGALRTFGVLSGWLGEERRP